VVMPHASVRSGFDSSGGASYSHGGIVSKIRINSIMPKPRVSSIVARTEFYQRTKYENEEYGFHFYDFYLI